MDKEFTETLKTKKEKENGIKGKKLNGWMSE